MTTTQELNYAKGLTQTLGLKYCPDLYRDRFLAFASAARQHAGCVMLGLERYWVVCLADAAKLERAGFEFAS